MKLICSECGQSCFEWPFAYATRFCRHCRDLTEWVTKKDYRERREKAKHGSKRDTC